MTDEKVNDYRIKSVEETLCRLSKTLFGNGEKGMVEIVKVLADRMEQRKETHDKDVSRIEQACEKLGGKFERLLWWMLAQVVTMLIALVMIGFEVLIKK